MQHSPLFWPVRLKNNIIHCLDETVLPHKLVYRKAKNLTQTINLITSMKTRAFGQVLMAYNIFLMILNKNKKASPKKLLSILQKTANAINKSRPTFPFSFFTGMVSEWANEAAKNKKDIAEYVEGNIKGFLSYLKIKRIEQSKSLSAFLKNGDSILTHCNVSGSLVLAAQFARKQNKKVSFYATETRPYLQGSRLTAWELKRAGFPVTIITDGMVAYTMRKKLVNKVVVGADQMAQNGDFANKIGTYQIAVLARKFKLPFFVLSPPPSRAKTGKDIKIEIRPDKEMFEVSGRRIAPKKAKGFYPAFDVTPKKLVTKHITLKL